MKKENVNEPTMAAQPEIEDQPIVEEEIKEPVAEKKKKYAGYKCRHFTLKELLPKELYIDEETGWEMFDEKLLRTIDVVRDIAGVPLICNDWASGGNRNYCGARTPKSKDYKSGSFHSVREDRPVMAVDLISLKLSAEQIKIGRASGRERV